MRIPSCYLILLKHLKERNLELSYIFLSYFLYQLHKGQPEGSIFSSHSLYSPKCNCVFSSSNEHWSTLLITYVLIHQDLQFECESGVLVFIGNQVI